MVGDVDYEVKVRVIEDWFVNLMIEGVMVGYVFLMIGNECI